MSIYEESKLLLSDEQRECFGELGVLFADKWNHLLEELKKESISDKKVSFSTQIKAETLDKVKDACYVNRENICDFTDRALNNEVERSKSTTKKR